MFLWAMILAAQSAAADMPASWPPPSLLDTGKVSLQGAPGGASSALPSASQEAGIISLDLQPLFNAHLCAEKVVWGQTQVCLSIQEDSKKKRYLSVQAQDWPEPKFLEFAHSMKTLIVEGSLYKLVVERRGFWNGSYWLVVKSASSETAVYEKDLMDLIGVVYAASRKEVDIAGNKYRLFYSYDVDRSTSPAVFQKSASCLGLLYDPGGGKVLEDYVIALNDISGQGPFRFDLYKKQKVYFQLLPDGHTLTIRATPEIR